MDTNKVTDNIKEMTREELIAAYIRLNNLYEEYEATDNAYHTRLLDNIEILKNAFNKANKYRLRWFSAWLITFILMIIFLFI